MKSLFIALLLVVFVFADHKIEKTLEGFYNKPRNVNFEPVVPKARAIKDEKALSSFTRMIVANKISKTSPAVVSSDPLLKKSPIDFSKHMLLVMFNGEPMKGNPEVLSIKTGKEMIVKYQLSKKFTIASYPLDIARYTAVVVEKFEGNIRFEHGEISTSLKSNLFQKKSDLEYLVTKPCSYLEHPPQAAIANPEIAIEVGTTFDMVSNMGSYIKVKFYSGKHGYLPNSSGCWHKLVSVYGKVVKLPFQNGKESIDLSKEKVPFMLNTTAEVDSSVKLGYLFHESAGSMLGHIEKTVGNKVKVRGVIEKEDEVLGVIRIYKIWRMKNMRNAIK